MPLVLDGITGVTFPAGGLGNPAGAVVGLTDTQTLTNKTLTSPTLTTPNINSAQFATVTGTAPIYPCRAWVNFNGTGTVAISGSGNVTQVNDNGTGDYTVVFTTAIADTNYAVVFGGVRPTTNYFIGGASSFLTTSVNINTWSLTPTAVDYPTVCVSIFR